MSLSRVPGEQHHCGGYLVSACQALALATQGFLKLGTPTSPVSRLERLSILWSPSVLSWAQFLIIFFSSSSPHESNSVRSSRRLGLAFYGSRNRRRSTSVGTHAPHSIILAAENRRLAPCPTVKSGPMPSPRLSISSFCCCSSTYYVVRVRTL